ncbi:hypothetical protein KMI8_61 [Klebsiella phage KMI8]|nr:hypothetical protein KMI8_61 [Klebsiella phage KMI8]
MIDNIAYFMLLIAVLVMVTAYRKQSRELDAVKRELSQAKAEIEATRIHLNRVYSDLNDALGE